MHFFVKTINPRPTFHLDMSAHERETMQRHVAYWTEKARLGIAVAFGPVLDPEGVYGVGIYRADDAAAMQQLMDQDPARDLQSTFAPMSAMVIGVDGTGGKTQN